jgi:hypothetical protein
MPSDLAITLALLRFGALSATEKLRVLDEYQARSDAGPGGPHVWNPCVEVIESLWRDTNMCANETSFKDCFSKEERLLLDEIASLAWLMLTEHYSALVERSVFQTPIGQQLSSLCEKALVRLSLPSEEVLPFWDLMCYTCD